MKKAKQNFENKVRDEKKRLKEARAEAAKRARRDEEKEHWDR